MKTKFSRKKSKTHIENGVRSTLNNDITDRTFTICHSDVHETNAEFQEFIDDCLTYFNRFEKHCVIVVKIVPSAHRTPAHFTLTNSFKNHYEEKNEQNELKNKLEQLKRAKVAIYLIV